MIESLKTGTEIVVESSVPSDIGTRIVSFLASSSILSIVPFGIICPNSPLKVKQKSMLRKKILMVFILKVRRFLSFYRNFRSVDISVDEIGRAPSELQSRPHLVCRLL